MKAKEIFKRICPNEEFLPKPPEQEDIIFDHGDETSEKNEKAKEDDEDKKMLDNESNNQSEDVIETAICINAADKVSQDDEESCTETKDI